MTPLALLSQDSLSFMVWLLAIVYGITIHEFSHALAATLLGDPTPERMGRLTLNPLSHVDPLGLLLLVFAGFGWGRPVMFDPRYLKHERRDTVLVSIAGPISNFLSALVFAFAGGLYALYAQSSGQNFLSQFFVVLVFMNIGLGVFNLLPVPPLDGSRLLTAILPDRAPYYGWKVWLERRGPFLLLTLLIIDRVTDVNVFGFLFEAIFRIAEKLLAIL